MPPKCLIYEQDEGGLGYRGFILPPWAKLAQRRMQKQSVYDPVKKSETEFIVFGPYQKNFHSIVVSTGAEWLSQTGINELNYEYYHIRFHTNLMPYSWITNRPAEKNELPCLELWDCRPDARSKSSEKSWSSLTLTLDRKLLNFYVDSLTTEPGQPMVACYDLVSLSPSGKLLRCTGDGAYTSKSLGLSFDKNFVGFDEEGRLQFAQGLKNSTLLFQGKKIAISNISFRPDASIRDFSVSEPVKVKWENETVEIPKGLINLNQAGEIIGFLALDNAIIQIKVGRAILKVRSAYLADEYPYGMPQDSFPLNTRKVSLREEVRLQDEKNVKHLYVPGMSLFINKKGFVVECKSRAGNRCTDGK